MSELKAFESGRIYWAVEQVERVAGDIDTLHLDDSQFYLKSEADTVIAELEERHKMEVGQLLMEIAELKETLNNSRNARKYWRKEYLIEHKECCSQKYKRCLAMARMCEERCRYLTCLENYQMTDKEYQQAIGDYWDRWQKRWLNIAEQFKDKETK